MVLIFLQSEEKEFKFGTMYEANTEPMLHIMKYDVINETKENGNFFTIL